MGRGQDNDRIELPCKFGTLMCSVFSDNDDYHELAIDLVRQDGTAYQVCIVGTDEHGNDLPWVSDEEKVNSNERVHVYVWNGEDEDTCGCHYLNPNGDGWFTDDYRQFVNSVKRVYEIGVGKEE